MADMMIHHAMMARKRRDDYVTSGLQLWLDGINNTRHGHDETATGWEDLSGNGYDFTPITSGKMPTINADHYTGFDAETFLKCSNSTLIGMSNAKTNGTLEAVFLCKVSTTGLIFGFVNFNGNNNFAKMIVQSNLAVIISAKYGSSGVSRYLTNTSVLTLNSITNFSATYSSTNLNSAVPKTNGVATDLTTITTGWGNNGGDIHLGGRIHTVNTTRYPFMGNIYSIRFYNRRLTAAEQAHNREIDIMRFGAYK